MKISSDTIISTFRLFKYLNLKNVYSFVKQKIIHKKINIEVTLRDGTKTHMMSAFFLATLAGRKECISRNENIYNWSINNEAWRASYHQIVGLKEYINNDFEKIYKTPLKDKVVLDIGGFIGDSARYFLKNKAKKILIFEPSQTNLRSLKFNLKKERKNIEIYQKAISHKDGSLLLTGQGFDDSNSFALEEGGDGILCEAISFETLLTKYFADIAKVDCEGAEKYLLGINPSLLQKIPYWMIETHDKNVHKALINKFSLAQFVKTKEFKIDETVRVIHFETILKK